MENLQQTNKLPLNTPRYKYTRHTPECTGPDQVVIDRIIQAGTILVMPPGHHICDCERGTIALQYSKSHAAWVLRCSHRLIPKLREIAVNA